MSERPDEGAEATGSELKNDANDVPDSKGPLVMIIAFVLLLGAVIVLGILTKP
ncbi:hypothetical protein [Sandaracinus amylolyticus]|uniref:hypothetical protein n=1 Tax=Sandaracinus amylolyticus TaxID=927083 RepID=UPI001F21A97E|nr:hypothetical protein [Sandaracinus amylolyticus]UJR84157.1 Hypothetical protein I5071_62280 [Sandaracinus amylolyticus]